MNFLNRYQPAPWLTIMFFIGATASFAYGVFRIIHRHDLGGYFEAAVCVITLFYFNKNARRPTASLKSGQE